MLTSLSTPILRRLLAAMAVAGMAATISACGGSEPAETARTATPTPTADAADAPLPPPKFETALPEAVRGVIAKPFTGDLDEMVARRLIRVGAPFSRTFYFVDNGAQRGASYEFGRAFEDELNKKLKTGNAKVNVVFVPLPRDLLAKALAEGRIDLAVAQVTVRPEFQALVAFTNPTRKNVSEVVVTGPNAPRGLLGRRPVRAGRLRPKRRQVPREPGRAEREAEGQGQGARGHP